jgi:hypothetical protein
MKERRKKDGAERQKGFEKSNAELEADMGRDAAARHQALVVVPGETDTIEKQTRETRLS